MRKNSIFFSLVLAFCVFSMMGCTPHGDTESASTSSTEAASAPRPVRKRLCSLVIIGNLGNMDVDMAMNGFANGPAAYSAMAPKDEKRPKSVMSSLLDFDDDESGAELDELIRQQRQLLEIDMPRSARERQVPSMSMSTTTGRAAASPVADADEMEQLPELPTDYVPAGVGGAANAEDTESDAYLSQELKEDIAGALSRGIKSGMGDSTTEEGDDQPVKETPGVRVGPMAKPLSDEELVKKAAATKATAVETESPKEKRLTIEELDQTREEHVKEFLRLNQNVPEAVLKDISNNNFQNYSVWFGQSNSGVYYAVRYFEYVGEDFERDYFMLYTSAAFKAWIEEQQKYLHPTGTNDFMSPDVWLEMTQQFHTTSL